MGFADREVRRALACVAEHHATSPIAQLLRAALRVLT
jgi:hypothetical protein